MSGGSMGHLWCNLEDAANSLKRSKISRRVAFGKLLESVAEAIKAIDWHDSADISEEEEIEAILKCVSYSDILKCSLDKAKETLEELKQLIEKYENV